MTFIPNLAIFLILKESCLEIKKTWSCQSRDYSRCQCRVKDLFILVGESSECTAFLPQFFNLDLAIFMIAMISGRVITRLKKLGDINA